MLNRRLWGMLGLLLGAALWLAFDPPLTYQYPLDGHFALAGTFGELRSNHFHSGLDIKTYGKTGVPVRAAADGFVYRVKVSPYGYGKALYLRHADSSFTVYAHLERFAAEIEDSVFARQKKAEQAEMEWYLKPDIFTFRKGQVIGYSGNSGTSAAPHLHFEIRDPQERILNVLHFYRELIRDTRPPVLQQIAFEPIDPNSRINGHFDKLLIQPQGKGPLFQLSDTLYVSGGRLGIEYQAYDLLDAARNRCGVNNARLFLDEALIFEFDLQRFAFDETRFLNLHIDHPHYYQTGDRLQKAYVDHGNLLSAYRNLKDWGMIELDDERPHPFRLELRDSYDNLTQVQGVIRAQVPRDSLENFSAFSDSAELHFEVKRDVWVLTARRPPAHYLKGLSYRTPSGQWQTWLPRYAAGDALVFLMPLWPELYPVELRDSSGAILSRPGFCEELNPDRNRVVEVEEVQVLVPAQTVFAPMPLQVQTLPGEPGMASQIYEIGDPGQPLWRPFLVSFSPRGEAQPASLVVAQWDARASEWRFAGKMRNEEGRIYASVSSFGRFCLMHDSTGPAIRPLNFSDGAFVPPAQGSLQLQAEDAFAGIDSRSVRGTLDGKWILFEYDYRDDRLTHTLRQRPAPGTHSLRIEVKDNAGNTQTRSYTLRF